MSDVTINFTTELYKYFQKYSIREPEVLKNLREQTNTMSMGHMQVSPEQGQLMRLLIELMGAKKTLDIGVFTGYSSLSVALALPEDGKVIALDANTEWTKIAQKYWEEAGVSKKIDLILGKALLTLDDLIAKGESGTFDFSFIDADKVNYLNYYERSLQLLRPGGLVGIDNTLWYGRLADPEVNDTNTRKIREFNEFVLNDDRVTMSLVPIGDGLTLVRKK